MRHLVAVSILLLTSTPFCALIGAGYQDLDASLSVAQRSAWEDSYDTTPEPLLADLIWFAYAHGYGESIKYQEARAWHQKALLAKQPLAQLFQVLSLRNRHWINEYVEPDALTVNKDMNTMLQDAHRQFNQMPDGPAARCWQGLAELELGRIDDGLKLLHYAAESEYRQADAWLGYAYCYRKRDHKKAVHHLEIARQAQIAWSITELGHCQIRAWGVPRNRDTAIALYREASQLNERKALLSYSQHNGRDPDSLPYAERATAIGDPDARHSLAIRYERGHGCSMQTDKAIELHEALYEQFHNSKRWPHYALRAAYELGRVHDSIANNITSTEEPAALSVEQSIQQTQHYRNASTWYQNFLNTCRNKKDARLFNAHLALGKHAENGLGHARNPKQAFEHYTIAASTKNAEAHMRLADCYMHGVGIAKNSAQARTHYETALKTFRRRDPHIETCQIHYVRCLDAIDPALAIEKQKTFSLQGNAQATYQLIHMYRQQNINSDEIPALLVRAADQGHPAAQQELEKALLEKDADLLDDF